MADIKSFIIDSLKRVYEKSPFIYGDSDKMIHTNNSSTNATGDYSLAEGFHTLAQNTAEHAEGQYNVSNTSSNIEGKTQMSIGVGNQYISKNALEVRQNGDVYISGIGNYDGTNINKNTSIQSVQKSMVQVRNGANRVWCGSQSEYDALPIKYIDTLYFIKEDEDVEYVDLDLPSGNLWATANIGATNSDTSISWYGGYFAWGEVAQHEGWPEDKTSHPYNWNEYQYAVSDDNELTKYCNNSIYGYNGYTDSLTELETSDDVVHAVYGENWKMPSQDDFQELIDETNNEWVTNYQGISGLNGYVFRGNNQELFLPAAGHCSSSNLRMVGVEGYYWSSSLDVNETFSAQRLYFKVEVTSMSSIDRFGGFTVRPVRTTN